MGSALEWDIGIAVNSEYDEDGFPTVQIDALGEEKSGVAPYELHSTHGFLSIPLDPEVDDKGTPTLGCTTLFAMEGGRGHAWLCADPRVIVKLPILKKGEALFHNSLGQFVRLDSDGSATIFTTDTGKMEGQSVYLQVAKDALRFVAPWGTLTFDAAGFRVKHWTGAKMALGGLGGLPMGLGTYFKAQAAIIDCTGQAVTSGGKGATQPLTLAAPLIEILTELISIVAAINATTTGAPAASLTARLEAIIAKTSSA